MACAGFGRAGLIARAPNWPAILACVALACAAWAVLSAWQTIVSASADTVRALWLLPALIGLHLVQLFLSASAWRRLLPAPPAGLMAFNRLRLVREGIDSLLPVAQVGGELVAARLLARTGLPLATAAASLVVDVTLEFLSQIVFLLAGVAMWTLLTPAPGFGPGWGHWLATGAVACVAAGGFVVTQRFGLLRVMEALMRQIAVRIPVIGAGPLDGLHDAAVTLYRRRGPVAASGGLHLLAWGLGSVESWAVLNALGLDVSAAGALVVESLGMAGRSAGFAVPGALVVQETGFVLAAMAMGLPDAAGLALSLIKRVREVSTGLIGLALWHRSSRARA